MVNLVELQKPLIHFLLKRAGLRQHAVEIEPGTVVSFWVPKEKVPKKKGTVNEVVPKERAILQRAKTRQERTRRRSRPSSSCTASRPRASSRGSSRSAYWRSSVEACTVVGFSYGGMVAFKMAEAKPDLVRNLVVSGSVIAMTDSITDESLERLGFASSAELLLPESVKGLKALLSVATYRNLWFPDRLHNDYLKVMFSNRKERAELLEGLVISNKDAVVPALTQSILLLWGENDNIFNIELAKNMKEKLGEKTTLQAIKKAGHLAHLERPCVYNRLLKEFLARIHAEPSQK
uniref:AB hydrolase-1 domain-containing protein n=1 Tax=Ananas comosus var. bracteatus TaxID=296719 RepID=A0A6V7PTR5_ANACO|nr:unnamed protein product [Ananas comosus var. bracteatus]